MQFFTFRTRLIFKTSPPQNSVLRRRLDADGYLLMRGILDPEIVLKVHPEAAAFSLAMVQNPSPSRRRSPRACAQARAFILGALGAENPRAFLPGSLPGEGRASEGAAMVGLLSRQHIATAPAVRAVLEAPALFALAEGLLGGGAAATTAFKWLRCVAPGEFTGVHADCVYFGGRSSAEGMLTVWLPIGPVCAALGGLLVCHASHRRLSKSAGPLAAYLESQARAAASPAQAPAQPLRAPHSASLPRLAGTALRQDGSPTMGLRCKRC